MTTFAFVGGGSGGHLFPAVAVAGKLLDLQAADRILFLCSTRPVDVQILSRIAVEDPRIEVIPYADFPRSGAKWKTLRTLHAFQVAFRQARKVFRTHRPEVVVGIGAFPSIPGTMASSDCPIALMEHNVRPGRATRFLSRRADLVLSGHPFEPGMDETLRCRVVNTGVPLRVEFQTAQFGSDSSGRQRVLVLGGSQGAATLNRLIPAALARCRSVMAGWEVCHQAGAQNVNEVRAAYRDAGFAADVREFLPNMVDELRSASIVVSRSGAVTLAELAMAQRSAILVPLESSADNHQIANALSFQKAGAASIVRSLEPDACEKLASELTRIAENPSIRQQMSKASASLARPDATMQCCQELMRLC